MNDRREAMAEKPGLVQAIGIMSLVNGILNCAGGLFWVFTLVGIPLGAYSITTGVLEILYATKMMPDPIKVDKPAKYLAIMEIVNIVSFAVPSLVVGILNLVFYNDPKVIAYYDQAKSAGGDT
jgi:hypothetical protein